MSSQQRIRFVTMGLIRFIICFPAMRFLDAARPAICAVVLLCWSSLAAAGSPQMKASVKLSPAGGFTVTTGEVTGTAEKRGDLVRAKGIKVRLVGLKTGIDLRDRHTQKHLETEKFPTADLVEAIGKSGKGKAVIRVRGIKKQVQGTYELLDNEQWLKATFPIRLSEFGISGIRYMGVGVKDEVPIEVLVPVATEGASLDRKNQRASSPPSQ